jgi:hypothetical protein
VGSSPYGKDLFSKEIKWIWAIEALSISDHPPPHLRRDGGRTLDNIDDAILGSLQRDGPYRLSPGMCAWHTSP